MPRHIDAEKLYEFRKAEIKTNGYAANYVFGWNDAISKIEKEAPTSDLSPGVRAHWTGCVLRLHQAFQYRLS